MNALRPRRLHRTRRRFNKTPAGARYVGRPGLYANPFEGRASISHARSVIYYRSWVKGELTTPILRKLGFGEDEIEALARWRRALLRSLSDLEGDDLQCWCPLTSAWCHADVLLDLANPPRKIAA